MVYCPKKIVTYFDKLREKPKGYMKRNIENEKIYNVCGNGHVGPNENVWRGQHA